MRQRKKYLRKNPKTLLLFLSFIVINILMNSYIYGQIRIKEKMTINKNNQTIFETNANTNSTNLNLTVTISYNNFPYDWPPPPAPPEAHGLVTCRASIYRMIFQQPQVLTQQFTSSGLIFLSATIPKPVGDVTYRYDLDGHFSTTLGHDPVIFCPKGAGAIVLL